MIGPSEWCSSGCCGKPSAGVRAQPTLYDMRLSATEDVPDDRLAMLASDLRELVQVDVDEARTGYKSVEPPSWIALLERQR